MTSNIAGDTNLGYFSLLSATFRRKHLATQPAAAAVSGAG